MKALTLTQPWATLIASGQKRIETRDWHPAENPGVIVIASSKKPPSKPLRAMCEREPFASALAGLELPRCSYLAVARLKCCLPTEDMNVPESERPFGNFGPGRWGWVLSSVVALDEPVEIPPDPPDERIFRLGLWDIPDEQINDDMRQAIGFVRASHA